MVPSSDGDGTGMTRRSYLATAGAGLAATGLAGTAAAQDSRIRRRVVIPGEDDRFEDYNQDMFLHVIESTEVTLDRKEFDKCDFASWQPDSTTAYRTQIIDTRQGGAEPYETNAFVNQSVTEAEHALQPGSLYIINQEVDCPGRYVGLKVEFLSGRTPSTGAVNDSQGGGEQAATTTNGSGPGFGALGALGAVGAGALARAWRRD